MSNDKNNFFSNQESDNLANNSDAVSVSAKNQEFADNSDIKNISKEDQEEIRKEIEKLVKKVNLDMSDQVNNQSISSLKNNNDKSR